MSDDMRVPASEPPWAEDRGTCPPLQTAAATEVAAALERMVLHRAFPCLGARSAFARQRARVSVLDELGSPDSAKVLLGELRGFAEQVDTDDGFASFVAAFRRPDHVSEEVFERLLWQQLQLLRDADPEPWDATVSDQPADPHFSFSAAGTAYFVVELHPDASRTARRAPLPCLVFNPHRQFERLRERGQFERLQTLIRRRDTALQGGPNPMVADFGTASEARQYAGRQVPREWSPPGTLPSRSGEASRPAPSVGLDR